MSKSSTAATLVIATALGGCASPAVQNLGTAASNLGTAALDAGKAGVNAVRQAAAKPSDTAPAPATKPEVKKAAGVTWGETISGKAQASQGVVSRAASSFAWSSTDGKKITVTVSDGKKDSKAVLSVTGDIAAPDCNRSISGVATQTFGTLSSALGNAVSAPLKSSGVVQDTIRRVAPTTGATTSAGSRTAANAPISATAVTAPYAGLPDAQKTACIANEGAVKAAISAKATELSQAFSGQNKGVSPVVTYTSTDGAEVILGLDKNTGPTRAPAR